MEVDVSIKSSGEAAGYRSHTVHRLRRFQTDYEGNFSGTGTDARIGRLLLQSLAETGSTSDVSRDLSSEIYEDERLREAFDGSVIDQVLTTALKEGVSEADEITLWEYNRRVRDVGEFQNQRRRLEKELAPIVSRVVERLERIHGFIGDQEDPVDFDLLRSGLHAVLSGATDSKEVGSREVFEFVFLNHFGLQLASRLQASQTFWKVILLNLSYELRDRIGRNGTHLLGDAIDTLVDAVPRFEMLQGLIRFLEERGLETTLSGQAATPWSLICWRILTAENPSSDLNQRWVALFSSGVDSILPPGPSQLLADQADTLRGDLLEKFERYYVDWFDEAVGFIKKAANLWDEIARETEAIEEPLQKIAEDLSAGLRGADPVRVFSGILHTIIQNAYLFEELSGNAAMARRLFRKTLVVEMGFHPKEDFWRKYRQFSASLINLLSPREAWSGSIHLLRSIENIDRDFRDFPIRDLSPVSERVDFDTLTATGEASFVRKAERDVDYLLRRLSVDRRIHPGDIAGWYTTRWYADEVLYYLSDHQLPDTAFSALMDRLEASLAEEAANPGKPTTPALVEAFSDFVANIPRITSSLRLTRGAETIAADSTEYVFQQLPEYAQLVGDRGKQSAIRDNTLTLLQLARFNLNEQSEPMERLNLWWNAVVNSYIENRPDGLFEQNLNGLYFGLSNHLSRTEVNAVFPLIEGVYQESLGIRSLASRGGDCLALDGPLWRRILGRKRLGILGEMIAEIPAELESLIEAARPEERSALVATRDIFQRALRALGENSDLEASIAQTFPIIRQTLEGGLSADQLASTLRYWADSGLFYSESSQALLMPQLGRALGLAVGQVGFGIKLSAAAAEIADHYSRNMVGFDPESFPPDSAESSRHKGTRDQTLFLRAWGDSLQNQPLSLSFINGTRYFLEMLSPYVSYPERVWRLSARTVSKRLMGRLERVESYVMTTITDQWEAMCAELSETHEMAQTAFAAEDYSFSPRMGEDRAMRSLVGGIVAAAATPEGFRVSREMILERLALATSLPVISGWERTGSLLAELPQKLAGSSPGIDRALEILQSKLEAVKALESGNHSQFRAAFELLGSSPEQRHLYHLVGYRSISRSEALNAWWGEAQSVDVAEPRHLRTIAGEASRLEETLAKSIGSDESLNLICRVSLRHWTIFALEHGAETYPGPVVSDILADAFESGESGGWKLDPVIDALEKANPPPGFLACIRLVKAHAERLEVGALCYENAAKLAATLIRDFFTASSSTPGSTKTGTCDAETNREAFRQIFIHLGFSLFHPAIKAPRLFFGAACENLEHFPPRVVANAYAAVATAVYSLLPPGGSPFLDQGLVDVVMDSLPLTGENWRSTFTPKSGVPSRPVIEKMEAGLPGLLRNLGESPRFLPSNLSAKAISELGVHLSLFLSSLRCYGDPARAWMDLVPVLSDSCSEYGSDCLLNAYHEAFYRVDVASSVTTAPLWRLFLSEGIRTIENLSLARELSRLTEESAREMPARFSHRSTGENRTDNPPDARQCVRDQLLVLRALRANLTRYPPATAATETLRYLLQTTVRHLPYDTTGMQMIWRIQEDYFIQKLPNPLKLPLIRWMGLFQRAAASLPGLDPVARAVPTTVAASVPTAASDRKLAAAFVETLMVSQLVDDGNRTASLLAIGDTILRMPRAVTGDPEQWPLISARMEKALAEGIEGAIPGFALQGFANALGFLQVLEHLRGEAAGLGAFCAFFSRTDIAQALWKADTLASCTEDGSPGIERSGTTSLGMVSGLEIPVERDLKALTGEVRETVDMFVGADLEQVELPKKKDGSLGRIFKRKSRANPLCTSDSARDLLEYFLRRLNHEKLFGLEASQSLESRVLHGCLALSDVSTDMCASTQNLMDLIARAEHLLKSERGEENTAHQLCMEFKEAVPTTLLAKDWILGDHGVGTRAAGLVAIGLLGEANLPVYLEGHEAVTPEVEPQLEETAQHIYRKIATYARRLGAPAPFKISA